MNSNLFTNNASGQLLNSLAAGATSLQLVSGQGAMFPVISQSGDYFYGTLTTVLNGVAQSWERVLVTATAGDTFTIVRGQDGSKAQMWQAGTTFELRVTAAGLQNFVQQWQIGQLGYLSGYLSGRNLLINGAMRIDQRNAGAAVFKNDTSNVITYCVDRWAFASLGTGAYAQRGSNNNNSGYQLNLAQYGNGTTTSITLCQRIEAQNCLNLTNVPLCLSFQAGNNSFFPMTLTTVLSSPTAGGDSWYTNPASSNTLFSTSFTLPAGTPLTSYFVAMPSGLVNSINGLQVSFILSGAGLATGQFSFSQVQLEAGTAPTPFENRSVGQELTLCQRYYQILSTYILNSYRSDAPASFGSGFTFLCQMRATPTVFITSAAAGGTANGVVLPITPTSGRTMAMGSVTTGGTTAQYYQPSITLSAEL